MGMRCVAVFVDADANAPFVTEADEAVRLPDTYLDADAIIAAAQMTGAQAIHPGYGFLSENAGFARAVADAGLVWVGPSPEVIASTAKSATRYSSRPLLVAVARACGSSSRPAT